MHSVDIIISDSIIINYTYSYTKYTAMEFIYAQSPHSMKGLLIGLLFCGYGLSAALAAALFTTAPNSKDLCFGTSNVNVGNCVFWYYVFYMAVAMIGLAMYVAVAVLYRKRMRDRVDNHHNLVAEYYDRALSTCNST